MSDPRDRSWGELWVLVIALGLLGLPVIVGLVLLVGRGR